MTRAYVELSGESPELASAESVAAARALGGGAAPTAPSVPGLVAVDLPDRESAASLAGRLALARRCLVLLSETEPPDVVATKEAARRVSAAFRRLGRPGASDDPAIHAAGRAYVSAGGRIDLTSPERRFWLAGLPGFGDRLFEEVAGVDRPAVELRRMPRLPFRRPVSLPPRLARAAANLALVRPGQRLIDPFLGTGALLAEAGLLGARLYGIDRDPAMVRGALANLEHLGLVADALVVGDAGEVDFGDGPPTFDALLTDPPYGRSSSTGGEASDRLVARVVPRWASRLRDGGRVVLIVPHESADLPEPWSRSMSFAVRVHRSLTREFRVYERARSARTPPT